MGIRRVKRGGKSKQLHGARLMDRLIVHRFGSMNDALDAADKSRRFFGECLSPAIRQRAMSGDPGRQQHSEIKAEYLVSEALLTDPRLAATPRWERCEFGEIADPGLLASEDELPCFNRVRRFSQVEGEGEPIRIVVSTDASLIPVGASAAFMAAVRIVQQFRPVEIWWQGSWLNADKSIGYIFHVPLVQGDVDFTRLEFCISDDDRDILSAWIKGGLTLETKEICHSQYRASRSYLPAPAHFVDHQGVYPAPHGVASVAAKWLGLETMFRESVRETDSQNAAMQTLPDS